MKRSSGSSSVLRRERFCAIGWCFLRPNGDCFQVIYIDDRHVIQVLPKCDLNSQEGKYRDEFLVKQSEAACAWASLVTSEDKRFRFQEKWQTLGTGVNAASGKVASPTARRGSALIVGSAAGTPSDERSSGVLPDGVAEADAGRSDA